MGLETMADSDFHVRFYSAFGFRPAWTGISFVKEPRPSAVPHQVQPGAAPRDLSFIYPGLDVRGEAAAAASCGAGTVITAADGAMILHLKPTYQDAGSGFVPFLAAASRETFGHLMTAAEHLTASQGRRTLLLRVPGSNFATIDALAERGYRAGRVMVRMKAGQNLDYDCGPGYYLDNWL